MFKTKTLLDGPDGGGGGFIGTFFDAVRFFLRRTRSFKNFCTEIGSPKAMATRPFTPPQPNALDDGSNMYAARRKRRLENALRNCQIVSFFLL